MNMLFTSKANTLLKFYTETDMLVAPVCFVRYKDWKKDKEVFFENFKRYIDEQVIPFCKSHNHVNSHASAVRSSCLREDNTEHSGAGAYLSLLHIANKKEELCLAIDKVFASYGKPAGDDQVLVQPMIEAVVNGVLTTRVLTDGSPYYVINYDDESGKTDTVTSGSGVSKAVYVYREAKKSDFDSERLYSIVEMAKKIEKFCRSDMLDIEFCIDKDGLIYLLQVRPLCMQNQWIKDADIKVSQYIQYVIDFLDWKMDSQVAIFGKTNILGCMPDWNPAEMIGITPRPLAASLYRYFITQRIWSKAREMMGYRQMPPEELMLLLGGRPYIDVRLSFNSFLPQGLDGITGEVLIDAWIERLNNNPQFHDKVEFEIAQTSVNFTFDEEYDARYSGVLSKERKNAFKQKIMQLTANCMDLSRHHHTLFSCENSMAWAFDAIAELYSRQNARGDYLPLVYAANEKILSQIQILAEECKNFGTLAFSILARHAFIAESLLRSAVKRGALSPARYAELKRSIKTVSGKMSEDFQNVQCGKISRQTFMHAYGHLRPSTYDILSSRYADRGGIFDGTVSHISREKMPAFSFTAKEQADLIQLLKEAGLPCDMNNFHAYIRKAIAGREYAKFIFTKNISELIELIAKFGEIYGLDREETSYLDIWKIMECSSQVLLKNPKEHFRQLSILGKENFEIGRCLKLGYLIRSSRDLFVVAQHRNAPNFIGSGSVEAPVCVLDAASSCFENLDNCLICIESADPGFDWIFTRPIAGLITKFGGTNSHMAIRCAEYGLPAAIGVGEVLFESVSKAKLCILNVDSNLIIPRFDL